ncbi:toll-like receptor 1 precursor [Oncorhynchus mykiss]|uniref:Toll-like receptor 1 protein-like protein n=1 Tax=Oncorhynchus mykiss TaxID=8022 RepID=C9EH89_ONCMY|nr:toll-like receptor 1 precursor [Oncorhynchus mykiss]ACV92064.1 toll-like receptor 1 protein-like protein [Oncorhynchus mykiss]
MRAVAVTLWAVAALMGVHQSTPSSSEIQTLIVNLSSRNISAVPRNLPPCTEALDLSQNNIHKLGREDFQVTTHLRFLNLSWNVLEDIDPETFHPTPLLESLDLSHNQLQNLSDQRYLLLALNLRDLDLTFNMFHTMTLGVEFHSLTKLERLGLGAKIIRVEDFINITDVHLQTLTLRLENLTAYDSGSLSDVQAEKVSIGLTNKPTDRNLIADALLMFNEVELMGMNINGLVASYVVELVKERRAVNTTHLYLTNMAITWKHLTNTINAVFESPIIHLSTSDVAIHIPPVSDTPGRNTSHTKSFSARRAGVVSFFFSLEVLCNFFINMPVERLAMTETSIIHMTCPKLPSGILQLDFSDCALADTVFSRVEQQITVECTTLNKVNILVLRGNNLRSLQTLSKRVQNMISLRHLDLSLNSLVYSGQECHWPPNIVHLNLSSNGLSESVFSCLPNGTVSLDLQNNQISTVPETLLALDSLLALDLSANRLRDLPVCAGFPHLKYLLLRENSLHAPSVRVLETCPVLQVLDASRNPFTCTCGLRGFSDLGAGTGLGSGHPAIQLLHWPGAYRCSYPEAWRNSTLEGFQIPEISCNVGLLAMAILCPAVAVIIVMVTLCHHLDIPWYLGMIRQWTRAKHRARTQQVRPEELEGVVFHPFVSSTQPDADWVKGQLLPNLEGSGGGLHICRHERDFVPGKTIVENIIQCVERSRRCVFVLSRHFVRSEWCPYELYFASHQRLTRGSDSVILVLLEPLPQYMIPSKYYQLKAMMGRHTYLEWPQDRGKHRLFWANLRAALQADLPTAPVRDDVDE